MSSHKSTMYRNKRVKKRWFSTLTGEDSDLSTSKDSRLSGSKDSRLSSYSNSRSSSECASRKSPSVKDDPSDEETSLLLSEFKIITKSNLLQFVETIDAVATVDNQTTNLLANIADNLAEDLCYQVASLANYRKDEPGLLDLEFTLKREYNMEFANGNEKQHVNDNLKK